MAWAGVSTWWAVSNGRGVERLTDEQAELRAGYDEKIKALTRRLVGAASATLLEQDGLSGRLADIIARQVELENRQSALAMMADRLTGAAPPEEATRAAASRPKPEHEAAAPPVRPAPAPSPAPGPPAVRTLRLGDPDPPVPETVPGQRSALEPAVVPSGRRGRGIAALMALSLRDQFDAIEASMGRLRNGQLRVIGAYAHIADAGAGLFQAAVAETGLKIAPPAAAVVTNDPPRGARKTPADPFESEISRVEQRFVVVQRWREIVDSLPLRVPLEGGGLTSNFGLRKDPFTGAAKMHAGMDFKSPVGAPVRAAASGRVLRADVAGGYGNLVEIEHGHDLVTRYGHLSAINVSAGQVVKGGTLIGLVGSTGRSTGPHLHYETRISGGAVDPGRFVHAGQGIFGHSDIQIASDPVGEADSMEDAVEE